VVFEDLGEQAVKNIAHPIRAFKVKIGESPPDELAEPDADHSAVGGSDKGLALSDDGKVEIALWDSIKDSETVTEFDGFLERYPDGPFAFLARARREALAGSQSEPTERTDEDALSVELAFWEAAKDSDDPSELEAYLQRFPSGEFVALAEARLAAMRDAPIQPPENEGAEFELSFWNSIKDSGNAAMFEAYLSKYPQGSFAELAKIFVQSGSGVISGDRTPLKSRISSN
jgi:hypothetical protein